MKIGNCLLTKVFALVTHVLIFSGSLFADDAQAFFPDHYLSYDLKSLAIGTHHVKLRDQFIDWTEFVVTKPLQLLNPTVKRHNNKVFEIKNPKLHYTSFELKQTTDVKVNVPVIVTNQFGTFFLNEFRPTRILAPTRKKVLTPLDLGIDSIIRDDVELADHYLCYDIPPFEISTEFGFLKDQFRSRSFEGLVARRFCNPVAKIHNDQQFDIVNDVESNHLMCFALESERIFRVVRLLNQFSFKNAIILRDSELCVPSIKIKLPGECKGSHPDDNGVCNGACPAPNEVCQVDPATQSCSCFPDHPPTCFDSTPDSDGVCNGTCPNPDDLCISDTTGFCNCFPREPIPCFEATPDPAGLCGGFCPDGDVCVVNPDQKCQCQPFALPCSLGIDGQCGGVCPPQERCTIIPGTVTCGCVL